MSRKKHKIGECIYCGQIRPITYDHIPPKNLFAKPRPNNLLTVPSCKECHSENKQISMDDEYFRLMLVLRDDTHDHPDVKQVLPTVLRSLKRPDKIGFSRSLINNMKDINLIDPNGLLIEKKKGYNVNLARLDTVVSRVIKGLFYYEKGYRLPDTYEAVAYSESGIQNFIDQIPRNILHALLSSELKTAGNQVLSYQVAYVDTDLNTSVWLLTFYNQVRFVGITINKDERQKN